MPLKNEKMSERERERERGRRKVEEEYRGGLRERGNELMAALRHSFL